ALELAERMRTIAETSGARLLRLQAHHALWTIHYFRGELAAALQHLDDGEPLYDPSEDRASALVYTHDAKASALSDRSMLLWHFGRVDQALDVSQQSVEYARELGHPITLGYILANAAWLRFLRREPEACRTQAESVIAHTTEHGVTYWMPHGVLLRGWALAEQGEVERGIVDIEHGLASMAAMGTTLAQTVHFANLAAAMTRAGRVVEGRALMERAKASIVLTGERYHAAEIHRLDAEMTLAETGDDACERAEAQLRTAIECAIRQGARTLELRATTSLARIRDDMRPPLANLLASFAEGFATADLQEPEALLRGPTGERLSR
ncbi:MAG TPA: hypothetical protein VGR62_03770, partial [Candidatus Binatia bacterium]|nr:hypothetical protein [Candidatus Binatia bacterium]